MTLQYQYSDLEEVKLRVDDHESRLKKLEDMHKDEHQKIQKPAITTHDATVPKTNLNAGDSDAQTSFDKRIRALEREILKLKALRAEQRGDTQENAIFV